MSASEIKDLEKSLKIADKKNMDWKKGEINSLIGDYYIRYGKLKKAALYIEESNKIFKKIGFFSGLLSGLSNIAEIERLNGNFKSSLKALEQILEISKKTGSAENQAIANLKIGILNMNLKDYDKALENIRISYEIAETLENLGHKALSFNYLGEIFLFKKDFDEAELWLTNSLDLAEEIQDFNLKSRILSNLGILNYKREKYEEAFSKFGEALAVDSQLDDTELKSIDLNNMGLIYRVKGDGLSSYNALNEASTLLVSSNLDSNLDVISDNIKECSKKKWNIKRIDKLKILSHPQNITNYISDEAVNILEIGLEFASLNNYDSALEKYNEALQKIQYSGDCNTKNEILITIAEYYSEQGLFKKALEFVDLANQSKTKIFYRPKLLKIEADVYYELRDYNKSFDRYVDMKKISTALGDLPNLANSQFKLSIIYFYQQKYSESIKYLEEALNLFERTSNIDQQKECLEYLAKNYAKTGNHKASMKFKLKKDKL